MPLYVHTAFGKSETEKHSFKLTIGESEMEKHSFKLTIAKSETEKRSFKLLSENLKRKNILSN